MYNKNQREKIKLINKKYLNYLIKKEKLKNIDSLFLNTIFDAYDYEILLINIKKEIETEIKEYITSAYFFELLFEYAVMIDDIKKEYSLEKFSYSINVYLYNVANIIIKNKKYMNDRYFFEIFPIIAKVTNYLLNFDFNLTPIVEFLLEKIEFSYKDCIYIPNFYIKDIDENFKKQNPKGILSLGMAHGVLGVLKVLSDIYYLNLYDNKIRLKDGIFNMFSLYEIFQRIENNTLIFPNFITYEEYIDKEFKNNIKQKRAGWCSGNLIYTYSLYKISKNMNNKSKEKFYFNEMMKILEQKIEDYKLEIHSICHGYSFPLILINILLGNIDIPKNKKRILLERKESLVNILIEFLDEAPDLVVDNYFYNNFSLMHGLAGTLIALNMDFKNYVWLRKILLI